MSTIQKAFVFIVVVMAVLTAAANLVLFAQRSNWKGLYDDKDKDLKAAQASVATLQKDLAAVQDADGAQIAKLENEKAALQTEFDSLKKDLELTKDDKARQEALAQDLKVNYQAIRLEMDSLGERTRELDVAKQALEAELEKTKADAMTAGEQFAISERKSRDLSAQVASLTEQLAQRDERAKILEQKIAVLEAYAPPVGPVVPPASKTPVFGRITGFTRDSSSVFLSIGSDDGVVDGMRLLIYKSDGAFVAKAKVYNLSADKAAARVIQPVYGTIAEGDNVTNE